MPSSTQTRWHHLYIYIAISWIGLFIGCAIWQTQQPFKPTEGEIIFSHDRHIRMDIECEYCHVETPESELASDNNLPQEKDCMRCHKRTQGCALCHRDVKNAIHLASVSYRVKFSHKYHLQLQQTPEVVCTTCHLKIAESTRVADTDQPRMKVCRECHNVAREDCTICHEAMSADVTFLPVSHDSSWLERHRIQASQDDELCANCHRGKIRPIANVTQPIPPEHAQIAQAQSCADCHRGDIWPEEVHENNYIQTHSIDAVSNTDTCITCHDRQECEECHAERGFGYETVHPAGFAFQHEDEARRELRTCVTCHQEGDCLGCHGTISPHPSDWDRDMTSNNEEVCLACHTKGEL